MDNLLPFPAVEEPSDSGAESPGVADLQNSAHETSSSKLTMSDKLSALPSPRNAHERAANSPHHWPLQVNYRHSLDATASLPSFSIKELEAIRNDPWGPSLSQRKNRDANSSSGRPYVSGDSSPSKETPKQRVSFDSERGSQRTTNRVGQAFSRLVGGRASDPSTSPHPGKPRDPSLRSPMGGSPPTSRAASPLRIFHQWSSGIHRQHHRHVKEEPFIPVNPFKMRRRKAKFSLAGILSPSPSPDVELGNESLGSSSGADGCEEIFPPAASIRAFLEDVQIVLTDTVPRQMYLNMLLRIPAMYFSRVAVIFQDAEVSRPDIERMIDAMCKDAKKRETGPSDHDIDFIQPNPAPANLSPPHAPALPLPFPDEWTPTSVTPSLYRFKHSWESFIDSIIREWKTLNVVSALLSSAIFSIFQIPEAANDPVTRTLALISVISALMSLTYGCMYIVRFATMRSMFRASRWAEEARKTKTRILWNVWVMLAMPAVWISWAMLFFLASILSFVWRTGSEDDPANRLPLSRKAALGPRIMITVVFVLGIVYLLMIIRTLKRYGGGSHPGSMYTGARKRFPYLSGAGEGLGPEHPLSLSRMRTPESDKDSTELRGRKRQRVDHRNHSKAQSGKKSGLGEMEKLRKGGFLKDLESSFDSKLGVVNVKLANSAESL